MYLHSNVKQIKIVLFNILNHQSSNHEIMVKTEIAVNNWLQRNNIWWNLLSMTVCRHQELKIRKNRISLGRIKFHLIVF